MRHESLSQDLTSIANEEDKAFIAFMHSGSPMWVNKGFKEFNITTQGDRNEKGNEERSEKRSEEGCQKRYEVRQKNDGQKHEEGEEVMLNRFGNTPMQCEAPKSIHESRYSRNERDDLKTAIDALYEFKRKLDELHPSCIDIIDNMLQRPRY